VKRLAGLVFLVVATAALAEWWPITVPGQPRDVEIEDAGHFAMALYPTASGITALEVVQLPDGGTLFPRSSNIAVVANAYLYYDGGSPCLSTIDENGIYAGCNEGYSLMTSGFQRARHTASGGAYAVSCPFTSQILYASNTHSAMSPYNGPSSPVACFDSLATVRLGATDYGLFGVDNQSGNALAELYAGIFRAGNPVPLQRIVDINDVAIFGAGALPGGLVAGREGLELLSFGPDGGPSVVVAPGLANVTGVAFATGTGDPARGDGFGMAVAQLDAGAGVLDGVVFSAVPNPNSPGVYWVRNTWPLPAPLAGPVSRVMCHGAEFCVLITGKPDGGPPNVVLYNNTHRPDFNVDGGRVPAFDEGDGGTVVADVTDDDGDAIYVTWDPIVDPGAPLVISPDPSSIDGRSILVSTLTNSTRLCGKRFEDFYVVAHVTDGWSQHISSRSLPIRVNHTLRPPAPTIVPASRTVDAGAGPVTFDAQVATSCATEIVWSEVGDAGFSWSATPGGQLTVATPPTYCQAGGGTATYLAQAMEVGDGGVMGDAGVATLTVLPWGPPDAAFPPGYTALQDGGTREQYSPLAEHDCIDALNFPGLQTTWTLDSRGLDASIAVPGGVLGPGPVVNREVELQVPDCVFDAGVTLFATHEVLPPRPYQGPTSSMEVRIRTVLQPVWGPGGAPTLVFDRYDEMTGTVFGSVSTGLNCPRERGLKAELSVTGPDGALLVEQVPVDAPGPFALQLDGGCQGGTFQLTGLLFESGGRSLATQIPFTGGTRAVLIDRISPDNMPATCEGVNGQLQVLLASGSCPSGSFAWQQTGGPPMELAVRGTEATVTSQDAGLNELVGQFVSFHVSASAGPGTDAGLDTSVQIVAEPFVKVIHRTEVPVSSESGVTGVAVRLENQASCPVSGVSYVERLDGLKFVPGTARIAGQPVAAALSEDDLVFSDLELPAGGSVELSFMARPRLLSAPKPSGQAFLRGVPVSERAGIKTAPPPGCGCSGAPGELAAYALATLGLLLGRRRVRTRS
jgi:hypothetical protein